MDNKISAEKSRQEMNTTELARERNDMAAIRTQLANERTFLSWARASLGIITLSFVLEKAAVYLRHIVPDIDPKLMSDIGYLSVFTLVCGIVLIVASAARYFTVGKMINCKKGFMTPIPEILIIIALALVLSFSFFYGRNLNL